MNILHLSKLKGLIQHNRLTLSHCLKLIAIISSCLLMAACLLLPEKRLTLFPTPYTFVRDYSDAHMGGSSTTLWSREEESLLELTCILRDSHVNKLCGASIKFSTTPQSQLVRQEATNFTQLKGINLEHYQGIEVDINYTGQARKIHILLRDIDQKRPSQKQFKLGKVHLSSLHPEEYDREVYIPFEEFGVADWWIEENNIHRKQTAASYHNIMEVVVSLPGIAKAGTHIIKLQQITAVGKYITQRQAFNGLLWIWLAYATFETLYWLYQLIVRHIQRKSREKIRLNPNFDKLTHTLSRKGIMHTLSNHLANQSGLDILLMEVDNFDSIYKDNVFAGERALRDISQLIQDHLSSKHYLGRWSQYTFIVVGIASPQAHAENRGKKTAEAVRASIEKATIHQNIDEDSQASNDTTQIIHSSKEQKTSATQNVQAVTISCGISHKGRGENFKTVLERAEKALFIAKSNGNNMCVDL